MRKGQRRAAGMQRDGSNRSDHPEPQGWALLVDQYAHLHQDFGIKTSASRLRHDFGMETSA
jgi:hypothetical protein